MNLNFRNRITLYYLVVTALLMLFVFSGIFFLVRNAVYNNIEERLSYEASKHGKEVVEKHGKIFFHHKSEWEEIEHREIQVNPIFVQLMDEEGNIVDKSPNLKQEKLHFSKEIDAGSSYNSMWNDQVIRQMHLPIKSGGTIHGYITVAVSLKSASLVLDRLRNTLLLAFPLMLIGLFFASRYLAGQSTEPILNIIRTTDQITRKNLDSRVQLPKHEDELLQLTQSINDLLDRLRNAIKRERQFTSDASHELRTPLSTIKGTLEVMLRKERDSKEYQEKSRIVLAEIDKITHTVDQLLQLARMEEGTNESKSLNKELTDIIAEVLELYQNELQSKNMSVEVDHEHLKHAVSVQAEYGKIIIQNILSNAIKYSRQDSKINIRTSEKHGKVYCSIEDHGLGISKDDQEKIFHPFFRSDALNHKHIEGNGLGLSIAQKAAEKLNCQIHIQSELGQGTRVILEFNQILS